MSVQTIDIYLASRWSRQPELRKIRDRLQQKPIYRVVSGWIDTERPESPGEDFFLSDNGNRRLHADFEDIRRANLLVAETVGGVGRRGGMMIEIGYALGLNKPVILIGDPLQFGIFGNVFTEIFPDWPSAFLHYF